MSRPGEIGLADAVAAIREELLAAAESGNGQELQFTVGPVDLEFTVVLRTDATVKSGFRAWVLSADAEAGLGRERTQRIALTLTPRYADGRDFSVRGGWDRPAGSGTR
ncbi:trypco2 family protein [Streptomyces achromogenes]|uniref:trypco2 family protein n=1 Tax=Streptomyces achromogenes TaxID=67255 RepID=UPI003441DE4F